MSGLYHTEPKECLTVRNSQPLKMHSEIHVKAKCRHLICAFWPPSLVTIYPDQSNVSLTAAPRQLETHLRRWVKICTVKTKEVLSHWQPLNFDDMWDSPNAMKLQFYVYNTHFPVSQWALFLALGESHCTSVDKYSGIVAAMFPCWSVNIIAAPFCTLLAGKHLHVCGVTAMFPFSSHFPWWNLNHWKIQSQFSVIQMINNQFPPDISQQLRCCSVDLV